MEGLFIRLLEYESKRVFSKFGIPLVESIVIEKQDSLEEKVKDIIFPAIIKAQIAIGSRKKKGLIKIAKTVKEAKSLCKEFFQKNVGGFQVKAILIEKAVEIIHEYYCAIVLDASEKKFFIIVSKEGGIDIEEVALTNPKVIVKEGFTIKEGMVDKISEIVALRLGFFGDLLESAKLIFNKMWKITLSLEAELVEINPLVLTPLGLRALDGKIIVDDNAAFRQPIIKVLQNKKLTTLEKLAKEGGFSFVELKGDVGILANGAGLTMALLDILSKLKLKAANFLDIGGGASKDRVYKALDLLIQLKPKCILINIFGGITRCDIVAEAIIQALNDFNDIPSIVIRLAGTKEAEGIFLLKKEGINVYVDIMEAIEKLIELV